MTEDHDVLVAIPNEIDAQRSYGVKGFRLRFQVKIDSPLFPTVLDHIVFLKLAEAFIARSPRNIPRASRRKHSERPDCRRQQKHRIDKGHSWAYSAQTLISTGAVCREFLHGKPAYPSTGDVSLDPSLPLAGDDAWTNRAVRFATPALCQRPDLFVHAGRSVRAQHAGDQAVEQDNARPYSGENDSRAPSGSAVASVACLRGGRGVPGRLDCPPPLSSISAA